MNSRDIKVDEWTRRKWRELGFFYKYIEKEACWKLVGSRNGLIKFCDLLHLYAGNPKNEGKSEHDHYGPYKYLEIMTWDEPQITDHAISGSLADLQRLSEICREKIDKSDPGTVIIIDKEYSQTNTAKLQFEVQKDDFDPASVG
jgi:hypothetical protein